MTLTMTKTRPPENTEDLQKYTKQYYTFAMQLTSLQNGNDDEKTAALVFEGEMETLFEGEIGICFFRSICCRFYQQGACIEQQGGFKWLKLVKVLRKNQTCKWRESK